MTDDELLFYSLCGPLEDAIELIDEGQLDQAKALLGRTLQRAREKAGLADSK